TGGLRRAMRREDSHVMLDPEIVQGLRGVAHYLPVALRAHDDGDQRFVVRWVTQRLLLCCSGASLVVAARRALSLSATARSGRGRIGFWHFSGLTARVAYPSSRAATARLEVVSMKRVVMVFGLVLAASLLAGCAASEA